MKRNTRNIILKIAEVGLCLGMVGGGIYGMAKTLMNNENADHAVNRYLNDNSVYEYIQDDMKELNNRKK